MPVQTVRDICCPRCFVCRLSPASDLLPMARGGRKQSWLGPRYLGPSWSSGTSFGSLPGFTGFGGRGPPFFHASAARAATATSSVDDPSTSWWWRPLRLRLPPPHLLVIAFAGLTCWQGRPCPCCYQRSRCRGRPLVVVLGSNFLGA
jgi:hypothetical protein